MSSEFTTIKNRLIAALPSSEKERLVPHGQLVSLAQRQVLHQPGLPIDYVYFPYNSIISLVTLMEDGSTVESGITGNEGFVGTAVILGSEISYNQAIVQIGGDALKMPASQLIAEFKQGGTRQTLLLRYVLTQMIQVSQGAACNRLHTIDERFARWLLTISDRLESNELSLTQEFIATMLGIRRSGVTVAAGILQQAGLINYKRGQITILEREKLEEVSCECYEMIKTSFSQLLGVKGD